MTVCVSVYATDWRGKSGIERRRGDSYVGGRSGLNFQQNFDQAIGNRVGEFQRYMENVAKKFSFVYFCISNVMPTKFITKQNSNQSSYMAVCEPNPSYLKFVWIRHWLHDCEL